MIAKIIGTMGTRVYVGIVMLLILGLHTNNLGAETIGKLAIFRFALSINHLFASVFSGPAIVYIGNRISVNKLVIPTFLWTLASITLLTVVQTMFNLVPEAYFFHLLFLSLLFTKQSFLEQVLLTRQQINTYNLSTFIHHTFLIGGTLVCIFGFGIKNENAFFFAFYAATGSACVFLLWATRHAFSVRQFSFNPKIATIMLNYGFWVQLNNFFQMLNYRFTLLLLDYYWGKRVVGYFSAALQLAEAIWIIAKSLATVQYTRIAANKSKEFAVDLTALMSKASFVFSLGAALVLIAVPESVIGYCLGKDFTHVKEPMMCLLPGILFFSTSLIYCHYFSGLGKFFYNTAGSLISLVIIVTTALITVPFYGSDAAALSNSAGLLGMLIFNLIVLVRNEKIPFGRLIPGKNDLKKAGSVLGDFVNKN